MKKLYQYVVVFHQYETNEQCTRVYVNSIIIVQPTFMLALNEQEVIFRAIQEVTEPYSSSPNDVQIIINPWVSSTGVAPDGNVIILNNTTNSFSLANVSVPEAVG